MKPPSNHEKKFERVMLALTADFRRWATPNGPTLASTSQWRRKMYPRNFVRLAMPVLAIGAGVLAFAPAPAGAAEDAVQQRVDQLERELKDVQSKLKNRETTARSADKKASKDDDPLIKWQVTGYAFAEYVTTNAKDTPDTFNGAHFSPIFHFQYGNLVLFEAEPELAIEDSQETSLELEYAQIDLMLHDSFTLVAGKYLSPVGQFMERLHPEWINKSTSKPAGFDHHGGIQPASDIGIQARGGIPFGDMTATYVVAVGNGPQIGDEGFTNEGWGTDNNDNKAVSGRIGFLPVPYFELGASFEYATVKGWDQAPGTVTAADFTLWGIDAAFTRGPWDVRFEYLNGRLGSHHGTAADGDASTSLIPKTDYEAWYAQAAYLLSGFTKTAIVRNFEPVIRYGEYTGSGFGPFIETREKRFNIGLNYHFAPSVLAKGSYEIRDMKAPGVEDEKRFIMQLVYGF